MSGPLILASGVGDASPLAAAAAIALASIPPERGDAAAGAAAVVDLTGSGSPRPSILAAPSARLLADRAPEALRGFAAAPRGRICALAPITPGEAEAAVVIGDLARSPVPAPTAVAVPPQQFRAALAAAAGIERAVLIQAERSTPTALLSLLAAELRADEVPLAIWRDRPGAIQRRRALAGLDPGGEAGRRASRAAVRFRLRSDSGQALPALLGLGLLALALAFALAALGGAASAKGRAQRAVDLAAVSAARSMQDDFDRLFSAARRPGAPNGVEPLSRSSYLARARTAARRAAVQNGLPAAALRVSWPDRDSIAPTQVRVRARLELRLMGEGTGGRHRGGAGRAPHTYVEAAAAIGLAGPAAAGAPPVAASGGGYAGRLAYRQGKPMRPDVARAFDRLVAAGQAAGVAIVINSAYRSDEEQAALFAANPDPRWVAPPGRSLHRCGTELDLGPPGAHGWLLEQAPRFGFRRRYDWEPWHFGFVAGPVPCSGPGVAPADPSPGSGRSGSAGLTDGDGRSASGAGLPGFVPPAYRKILLRAAQAHNVSVALLAAQLMAESNFNPAAVSSAGARGIAQFMPATAAAYGLSDPLDPRASIDAQARLISDLLDRFGAPSLALAAYNAGPAAVAACSCIPPYPETQAYVARILGLLGGAAPLTQGGVQGPGLEVRLIR